MLMNLVSYNLRLYVNKWMLSCQECLKQALISFHFCHNYLCCVKLCVKNPVSLLNYISLLLF